MKELPKSVGVIQKITITKNSILHVENQKKKPENLKKHYFYSFDTMNCKCKALRIKTLNSKTLSIKARSDFYSNLSFHLLTAASNWTKYLLQRGKLHVGSKSIRYSGDFVIEGFHYTTDLLHCRSVKKNACSVGYCREAAVSGGSTL